MDNFLFEDCTFGEDYASIPAVRKDIRDVEAEDLAGFDAVIPVSYTHLNAASMERWAAVILNSSSLPCCGYSICQTAAPPCSILHRNRDSSLR